MAWISLGVPGPLVGMDRIISVIGLAGLLGYFFSLALARTDGRGRSLLPSCVAALGGAPDGSGPSGA